MKNKRMWRDIIGSLSIFLTIRLFGIGSNYEGLVIVLLGLIYWRVGE